MFDMRREKSNIFISLIAPDKLTLLCCNPIKTLKLKIKTN